MPIKIDNIGAGGGGGGITTAEADARYLLLNQASAQTVINGMPLFATGFSIGNAASYLTKSGDSWKLYVNGALREEWTTVPVLGGNAGIPIGILSAVTYPD